MGALVAACSAPTGFEKGRARWVTLPPMSFVKRGLVLSLIAATAMAQPAEEPIVVGPEPMVVLPPPLKRKVNWEPFLLTGAGAVMLTLGTWRLVTAENTYQQLRSFTPLPQETNPEAVQRARALADAGKFDTGVGWTLLGMGVAAVGGSLLWLFVEGLEKDPYVVLAPTGQGAAAVVGGRF